MNGLDSLENMAILSTEIRVEQDVVFTRQRARQIASLLGFDSQDQTRIATAVSEIARNAFRYASGGRAEFCVSTKGQPSFIVTISDRGAGIEHLDAVLGGSYRSETGMGAGIVGSQRLMDAFEISSSPDLGTTVRLTKHLPRKAPLLTLASVDKLLGELTSNVPHNPFEEIQQQNRELLKALEDLKAQQSELAQLNRELEDTNRGVVALYAELDEKADYLQRANDIKTRFLSNMTHEFRTPLNSISGLSTLLLDQVDGALNAEQQKQVSYIRRSSDELSELVNDLLDLAKVEAGKVTVRPSTFLVEDLFAGLRGMLKPLLASNTSVALVFDEPVGIPPLETDEGKVSQILRNFISNALKFTEAGEVRVSARLMGEGKISFDVVDTGIGIAAEDRELIFAEFAQIETAVQRRVRGTGLGLPLTRRLAGLLGGTVTVSSEVGIGSTFCAVLPTVYRGPDEASFLPEISPEVDPTRQTILVIEDNKEAIFIYEKYLKPSGFQVLPVGTAKAARQILKTVTPVAILCDVLLEAENTWALISELKAASATRQIPVIVITMVENERKARALGADAFHLKPVERQWLLDQLQQLTTTGPKLTALIVDDDDISRYLLKGLLISCGYRVIEATNGFEGLRLARSERPHVIFLDLKMPDMDGYETLTRLRGGDDDFLSVVIHTSQTLGVRELERLHAQTVEYLPKGLNGPRTEVVENLKAVIARARGCVRVGVDAIEGLHV